MSAIDLVRAGDAMMHRYSNGHVDIVVFLEDGKYEPASVASVSVYVVSIHRGTLEHRVLATTNRRTWIDSGWTLLEGEGDQ